MPIFPLHFQQIRLQLLGMVTIQYLDVVDEWIYVEDMALFPLLVGLVTEISDHFGSVMELVGPSKVRIQLSKLIEECILIFNHFLGEEEFKLFHELAFVELDLKPVVLWDESVGVELSVDGGEYSLYSL